MMGNVVNHPFL